MTEKNNLELEKIKKIRIRIDGVAGLVADLKPIVDPLFGGDDGVNSNQIRKCYDSLLLAKAHLGELLKWLGDTTPYVNEGNRHVTADIEPTAEKAGSLVQVDAFGFGNYSEKNHIEKIDYLRNEIYKIYSSIIQYTNQDGWVAVAAMRADQHLTEARFWLGFELARYKESKK